MAGADAGVIRVPGRGRRSSGADERITIQSVPDFFGSVKLPRNTAPDSRLMTSPDRASFRAAWRSPPARTTSVRPDDAACVVSRNTRGGMGGIGLVRAVREAGARTGA